MNVEAVEKLIFDANAKLTMRSILQNSLESTITALGRVNGPPVFASGFENPSFSTPSLANMDTNISVDLVVARLCQDGAEIRSLAGAPWIDDLEIRLGLSFPPSFRSLVNRYAFPLLDIGEVELFANKGDGSEYDLTTAPFRDPFMSPWLIGHRLIHIGHPYIGNYDPVCFDLSTSSATEPPVVQLNHEDILLQRQSVKRTIIADSFLTLLERTSVG